ncbi:glycosyltransferase family 4 protein [Gelatiniphilus marinus]|uniref:Glycosyltransferase family 4 protein n=1 Tax=Gelatiniphilus marinus TaxID=1759464 RepID=A0ABW5JRN6_9FLAO
MKILIVSMRSIHTIRWVSQLKDNGHEVFYFDILNGGYIKAWDWVEQHTNWRYKFGNFKGRVFLKKHFPKIHKLFENNAEKEFEIVLDKFKPDVVHSFVMYSCCVPILKNMQKHKYIKWIYSAWGNDLYFYQTVPKYKNDIVKTLPRINYMFADCNRDLNLAKVLGFEGETLGSFPGGGGYNLSDYNPYIKALNNRNIILIKGYEQRFGKCSVVLNAISKIIKNLTDYKVVVFGADLELKQYLTKHTISDKIQILDYMPHKKVLELMGKSIIYIGNSVSDGMPNTLLEAIIMGAFPIQSNPGGATAEIIKHQENGLLIGDAENTDLIQELILQAINSKKMIENAFNHNQKLKHNLDFKVIQKQVLQAYNQVENELTK